MATLSSGPSRFMPRLLGMLVVLALAGALLVQWLVPGGGADPDNAAQVATGRQLYGQYCVACHLGRLQGQPNWEKRLPSGRMPAPPHDESGHTWHHPDQVLFGIIRDGMVPPHAPAGYQSDMPAFGEQLKDEQIWALLAFIKSHWSPKIQAWQEDKTRQY
ncbi:c-type cytochrome [Marinobacterium rhizophilum]|uniref:C-type cytochrome n=1 Tax=Marinobacterium rhizophilum TaxID=420402 RepID=A0ABY5HEF0_9GAMM|nr:c-type cytochrome [Marinobacterium rhizophilum]UTW10737.1 c-type cytochrome [Marinobacterium rhizophilum]